MKTFWFAVIMVLSLAINAIAENEYDIVVRDAPDSLELKIKEAAFRTLDLYWMQMLKPTAAEVAEYKASIDTSDVFVIDVPNTQAPLIEKNAARMLKTYWKDVPGPSDETIAAYRAKVDAFREANGLSPKSW